MPGKNETKVELGSPESVDKQKKTRYSLKKLLDRSRFSPRLLRIPRLTKSTTDGDQDLDVEVKMCSNADVDSITSSENLHGRSKSRLPFTLPEASGIPLDTAQHYSDGNFNPPKATSAGSPENPTTENPVEEDYEASLTQFANLITEGFKTSPSSRTNQPTEPHSQLDPIVCTDSQISNSHMWPSLQGARLANPVNEQQLTPPLQFDSIHRLSSVPTLPRTEFGAIYNEPCDAKPSDDHVTIYTVSSFVTETADGSSKESPHSSLSSKTDTDARALPIISKITAHLSTNDAPEYNDSRSEDLFNHDESEKQAPVVNIHGRPVTPSGIPSTSPTPSHGQPVGFVDAPRGNSVIVHHSTSPFARVPRGSVPSITTSCPSSTEANIPGEGLHKSAALVSKLLTSSTNTQGTSNLHSVGSTRPGSSTVVDSPAKSSSLWKNSRDFSNPVTDPNHRLRATITDSQPTYEEAWDFKMARKLGFGIPRLTSVPAIIPSCALVPSSAMGDSASAAISCSDQRLTSVTCPKSRHIAVTYPTTQPNPTAAITNPIKNRNQSSKHHPSGLIFHENRMFDQASHSQKSPASTTTEYDYAYNCSWSMGVKLNLSLAINGASDKRESSSVLPGTSATGNVTNNTTGLSVNNHCIRQKTTVPPPTTSLVPPQVPAHQNQRLTNTQATIYLTDRPRLKQPADSGLAFSEFDNGSTDSYDESWEQRHGKVVSKLTNARFVDPTALIPPDAVSSCSSVHSIGQPLSILTNTMATSEQHQRPGHCGEGQHYLGASPTQMSTIPVTPTGSAVSPSMNTKPSSPNMELLPLEEQPWFHHSLTRSEAEDLLRNQPEGSFLVRNSETCPNDYSLTIKHKTFLHMKISRNATGQYILGEYSQPYTTVPQMIYHYARTLVPVRGAESVTLIHPVCKSVSVIRPTLTR